MLFGEGCDDISHLLLAIAFLVQAHHREEFIKLFLIYFIVIRDDEDDDLEAVLL